jgi:NhaP-type Na+/H+ or K+/H+ antiporter
MGGAMPIAAESGFSAGDPYALGLLFAGIALFAAVVALSQQHERAFTGAVVYLVLGAVASLTLQLLGVDPLDPLHDTELFERVTELAVIIALFGAGLRLDRALSWRGWASTIRLIAIVMPVTIGAVALFGVAAMGLSVGAAVLLGAILSPTDPVLASDVQVGPPGDREEPEPHFALTSEAGFNDGLAFPFVFLGIFMLGEGGSAWVLEWVLADVVFSIAVGVALGVAAGRGADRLVSGLHDRGWLRERYDAWLAIAAVLAVYGVTELAGGYGFVAAFVGGLAFRRREHRLTYHGRVHTGADTAEKLAELAVVLLLGSTVTTAGLGEPGLAGWLLVPVLLLAIRPVAVMAALAKSQMTRGERLFTAWFGIRGIGSFYYAAVAINAGVLSDADATMIYWTVLVCVGVSIVLHGLTSTPATRRLTGGR